MPLITRDCCYREQTYPVDLRAGTADEQVFVQIWQAGDYDLSTLPGVWPRIWRSYQAIERPRIIDGGAHIGLAAVWFSLVFPRAEVISIEPEEENFARLTANTRALRRVWPVRAALGERFGRAIVTDPGEGNWAYQARPAPNGTANLLMLPIAEFVDPARIFMVKLDIEGAEEGVMRTAGDWLANVPVVILEVHGGVDQQALEPLYLDREVLRCGENVVSVRGNL